MPLKSMTHPNIIETYAVTNSRIYDRWSAFNGLGSGLGSPEEGIRRFMFNWKTVWAEPLLIRRLHRNWASVKRVICFVTRGCCDHSDLLR